MGIIGGILRQARNDTLYMQIDKIIDGLHLVFAILMSIRTDDRVAHLTSLCLNTIEHCRIIVSNQIWYNYTYYFRTLFTQTLGKGIRTVV